MRGFTLLEVLVVVVIIAILTTIGVLSIGVLGGDREMQTEIERYTDVLAAAHEQAQLEGRDFGILFAGDGYQVFVYSVRRQRWEPIADDRLYAAHPLPKGINLSLQLEARSILLTSPAADALPAPQVALYASGDADPYVLSWMREGLPQTWLLDGAADGTVKITKPEATP